MRAQQLLQPALLEGSHGFGGAADPLAGDEQLRDSLGAGARRGPDGCGRGRLLADAGVESTERYRIAKAANSLRSDQPQLAPLQCEQHHQLFGIGGSIHAPNASQVIR
jgi:hypothetical protein